MNTERLYRIKRTVVLVIAILLPTLTFAQQPTARQTLDKAVRRLSTASGISCGFDLVSGGSSASGTLRARGNRFAIVTPTSGAWYDGTTLTTYAKSSNEATIVRPTLAELRETNPLLFLGAAADYDVSFSKGSGTSTKRLLMKAKKRGAPARELLVTLSAASLTPVSIAATLSDGRKVTLKLCNVNLKASVKDSEFKFPKASYKTAKIVDLR